MLKDITVSNSNIMLVAIKFEQLDNSQITTLLYDVARELDGMKYECICVPQEGCTCSKWFGNSPYYYDNELDVWGLCVEPHAFTPQNIIDMFTKWKKINNINRCFYLSYNYCDTFWMPYTHKVRGFADTLHTTKKSFLDKKLMVYTI